jgi:hypothetical protein
LPRSGDAISFAVTRPHRARAHAGLGRRRAQGRRDVELELNSMSAWLIATRAYPQTSCDRHITITAVYHLGYSQYREDGVGAPETGNTIISMPMLLSTNPIGSVADHAAMHISAVAHNYETEVRLPRRPRRTDGVPSQTLLGTRQERRSWARVCLRSRPNPPSCRYRCARAQRAEDSFVERRCHGGPDERVPGPAARRRLGGALPRPVPQRDELQAGRRRAEPPVGV